MPFHISHIWWITKHINANSFPKIKVKKWKFVWIFVVVDSMYVPFFKSEVMRFVIVCVASVFYFFFGRILEKQEVRGPYFGHHHQLASARMIQWNWKLYCPCSHCSQFSVISNYLSRNQLAMVMRKHAEHDRGSWFSFFIFATINMMGLWSLRVDFENTAGARIANWNWGGTRPLSVSCSILSSTEYHTLRRQSLSNQVWKKFRLSY